MGKEAPTQPPGDGYEQKWLPRGARKREREHSNQRKGALVYTVFQMRETTSAKVQGLGRERLRSISSKLNRGSSQLV